MLPYSGPYYDYKSFMRQRYGKALQKVPVDFNYGCPHRDGQHRGGCTFCPEDGSRASQINGIESIAEQIEASVAFAKQRYRAEGFAAYVQAYTATFAPVHQFKEKMDDILSRFPFDALHLGTRPDCLPPKTVDYLAQLSQKIDLWVELGLQTVHDKTLAFIKREHDWACSLKGIEKLRSQGIQTVSHVILGLPGENFDDMMETAHTMGQLPLNGLKIHNLHVIRNTEMEEQHRAQPFQLLDEMEYIHTLAEFLRRLPSDLPVMRINTDTHPEDLIAPHWTLQKGQIKERLIRHMEDQGYRQGDLHSTKPPPLVMAQTATLLDTLDHSPTLRSPRHGEPYHPRIGARKHAMNQFIQVADFSKCALSAQRNSEPFKIFDIGFGLGYNSFLALEALKSANIEIEIVGFEMDKTTTSSFVGHHKNLAQERDWNLILKQLVHGQAWREGRQSLKVLWGDVRYRLRTMEHGQVDCIFLDGFDEKNNAELATWDFLQSLYPFLKVGGRLITPRQHPSFIRALIDTGYSVQRSPSGKGLVGTRRQNPIAFPEELDPNIIPYRDPELCWSHKDIVRQRGAQLAHGTESALSPSVQSPSC